MIFPKWQPIETAPKDGTDILVTGKTNLGHGFKPYYIEITHWAKDNKVGKFIFYVGNYSQPTHWMPLPVCPWQND